MKPSMKVHFDDTTQNWQRWGELVEFWICGLQPLPKDVKGLIAQATARNISNVSVPGSQDRNVVFYPYDEKKELAFMLPTEDMLLAARKDIAAGPYPLPVFYNETSTGKRKDLTSDQDTILMSCRVGEYTINNCA